MQKKLQSIAWQYQMRRYRKMNSKSDNLDLEDELFEHFRFDVPKGQLLLRIDKFLMNMIQNATRNKIQNAATAGDIYVK